MRGHRALAPRYTSAEHAHNSISILVSDPLACAELHSLIC